MTPATDSIVDLTPADSTYLEIPVDCTIHWTNKRYKTHPIMEIRFADGYSPAGKRTEFSGGKAVEILVTEPGNFTYTIEYCGGEKEPVTSGPFAARTCRNCG